MLTLHNLGLPYLVRVVLCYELLWTPERNAPRGANTFVFFCADENKSKERGLMEPEPQVHKITDTRSHT